MTRRALLVFLLLLSFAVHLALARVWASLGVLEQHDVLFDADPVVALQMVRDGEMKDRLWRAHPNLRNIGHPLVLAGAGSLRLARPGMTWDQARDAAALALAPVAAALATAATFLTFEALGAGLGAAATVALLQTFAFSSLIFGALPESYPLSGALLAWAWLLAARILRDGRVRFLAGGIVVALALGVTTTNAALAALPLLFAWAGRGGSWTRTIIRGLGLVMVAVALAAAHLTLANIAYGDRVPWRRAAHRQERFLAPRPMETLGGLPQAFASTLVAGPPERVATAIAERRHYRHAEMFTISRTQEGTTLRALRIVLIAALLLLGARRLARGSAGFLIAAALATLVVNAVLHSVYRGTDLLLYSEHWLAALVLLAGGLTLGPPAERRALAAFTVAAALGNLALLAGMVQVLAA